MRIGVPARDNAFFNCPELKGALNDALTRLNDAIVVAPRRAGKTSLMRTAADEIARANSDWTVAGADLSFAIAPSTLTAQLAREALGASTPFRKKENALDGLKRTIDAIAQGARHILLCLDEVDRPLASQEDEQRVGEWVKTLHTLREDARITLVMTSEPRRLREIMRCARPRAAIEHAKRFDVTPWARDTVERYLDALDRDVPLDTDTKTSLADALAPAWPYEIITTIFEYEDRALSGDKPAIDAVLDGAALAVSSGGFLDEEVVAALPKRDAAPALHLLQSLAKADETLGLEGLAGTKRSKYTLADLHTAAERLADFGLVTYDEDAFELRPATGMVRRRLALDFGEAERGR